MSGVSKPARNFSWLHKMLWPFVLNTQKSYHKSESNTQPKHNGGRGTIELALPIIFCEVAWDGGAW